MTIKTTWISARSLTDFVSSRGFKARPLTNAIEAAAGNPIRVVAYELIGPRGSRAVLGRDIQGYSRESAALWCDGVDYATAKLRARRTAHTKAQHRPFEGENA